MRVITGADSQDDGGPFAVEAVIGDIAAQGLSSSGGSLGTAAQNW